MSRPLSILYMGTPSYAQTILEALIKAPDMSVCGVVTQPDRPVGRKKILTPPPVKVSAQAQGVPVWQPQTLRDEAVTQQIRQLDPDFIVVAAYGQLLPRAILDIAPCINLHASILPAYRGASPIQQSLLRGDTHAGVSAMRMEEGLDSGPILGFGYLKIDDCIGLAGLMASLGSIAANLTLETLRKFEHIKPLPQLHAEASYCRKVRKQDGEILLEDAMEVWNHYRAYEGWPGIFLSSGLKLLEIELEDRSSRGDLGRICAIDSGGIVVACGKGALRLVRVQPPSKQAMDARAYCVGRGLKVGDLFI
jgi:methionyl-tRNA formyltransferase